jgi:cytochrome subunit of sulfide dehydrogenase
MRARHTFQIAVAGALAALTAGSVHAQTPPAGRLLASNCFQCHGTNGKGPGFDKLAGKSATRSTRKLLEFRAGKEGDGHHDAHAMGYSDAQLRLRCPPGCPPNADRSMIMDADTFSRRSPWPPLCQVALAAG